jgi:hypothetical protein
MQTGTAEVRTARRIFANRVGKAFELAAPHFFKVRPIGAGCGSFVKEDRHIEAPPDLEAGLPRQQRALLELDAGNGNEGDYVGRPDAGVDSLLASEVNEFCRFSGASDGSLNYGRGFAGDGDDGAIVIGIHGPVEEANAVDMHCGYDCLDAARVCTFGEVGNALN